MSTKPDLDRLHPILCAYVLNEASEAERAEVEAALAASPEVREELERLEGTIGLVRSALGGEERLSGDAMDALMRAAGEGSPPAPVIPIAWYRSPGLRAAAAVVALLGGVAAVLSIDGAPDHTDSSVASQVPAGERAQRTDELTARIENELAKLGEMRERGAGVPSGLSEDAREEDAELGVPALDADQLRAYRKELERAKAAGEQQVAEAYKALVDRAQDVRGSAELRYAETLQQEAPVDTAGVPVSGKKEAARDLVRGVSRETLSKVEALGYAAPGGGTHPMAGGGAGGGGDATRANRSLAVAPGAPAGDDKVQLDASGQPADPQAPSGQQTYGYELFGSDGSRLARLGEQEAPALEARRRGLEPSSIQPAPSTAAPGGPATPGPLDSPFTDIVGGVQTGGVAGGDSFYLGQDAQAPPDTTVLSVIEPQTRTSGGIPEEPNLHLWAATGERGAAAADEPMAGFITVDGDTGLYVQDFDVGAGQAVGGQLGAEIRLRLDHDGGDFFEDSLGSDAAGEKDVLLRDGRRTTRKLTPDELDLVLRRESERLFHGCRRLPHERPRDMFFRFWGDNAFSVTRDDALSTFGVDVDTASYVLARRYLNEGHVPEKAQVRTEEFVNYFAPDLDPPTEGTFAIHTELVPSLFGGSERRWMLRVGVRGKEIAAAERQPLVLTFVLDTSGSMKENNRLELVKHAVRLLVGELDARDSIAVVTFSSETRLVLPMTSAANRGVIEAALHPLSPNGSTNAEAGLKLGYEVALAALDGNAHNRVVFLSDGVANVGQTDQDRISEDVRRHRDKGLYLNTIGVGMNNHNDVFLEQLANKGDGICDYVDSPEAAQRAIVDRFTGAFQPIASDVKIQVEFDPAQVERYRLLGYENRAIADKDFRNDAIDAGEVGAGHQVVALYEIERSAAVPDGPLATVRLRWKAPKVANQDPNEVDVTEVEQGVDASSALGAFETAGAGYRRSVLAAQFAEFLRRSVHARGDSYEALMHETAKLANETADAEVAELVELVKRAYVLNVHQRGHRSELEATVEEYRRFQYLKCQLEELQKELGQDQLDKLRRTNDELEDEIRDLIRKDLERRNG